MLHWQNQKEIGHNPRPWQARYPRMLWNYSILQGRGLWAVWLGSKHRSVPGDGVIRGQVSTSHATFLGCREDARRMPETRQGWFPRAQLPWRE